MLRVQNNPTGSGAATLVDAVRLGELLAVLAESDNIADRSIVLGRVAEEIAGIFSSDIVTIDTVDSAGVVSAPHARFGLSASAPQEVMDPDGLRAAVSTGRPVVRDDRASLPPRLAERGVRAGVCVPSQDTSTVLSLYRRRAVPFSTNEIDLVVRMGRYLAFVLRRVQRVTQMSQLAKHSVRVGMCRGEHEVLDVAVDGILPLLDADAAGVAPINNGVVRFTVHRGLNLLDAWSLPVEHAVVASLIRDKTPFRSNDVRDRFPAGSVSPIRAVVVVPVEVGGVVVALLGAFRYTTRSFSANDEYVLTLLAGRVGAAMANAELVEETERRRRAAESLRDLSVILNASLSPAEIAERCCSEMLVCSGAARAALLVLDEDQRGLIPVCTAPGEETDFLLRFRGPFGAISAGDTPHIAQALMEHRPITQLDGRQGSGGEVRWLRVHPLTVHGGNLGVVLLEWRTPARPSPPTETLNTIAGMAATALEHAQLFARAEQSGMQLAALHDVAMAINIHDDIASTLGRIVDSARQLTGAAVARIGLVDSSGDTSTTAAVSGDASLTPLGATAALSGSVGAWVVRHTETAWVPSTAAGISEPPEAAAWIHDHAPGSAVAVPMCGRDGTAMGFLTLRHPQPYSLARSCLPILERFATEAGLAVENRRELEARRSLERQLREQATHDPLTGLVNRARFLEMIGDALTTAAKSRRVSTLAVIFLDLDRFKTVNDSLGHAAGDELLAAAGARVIEAVRPADVVGRYGGDEFVVLLGGLPRGTAAAEAQLVAERILLALAAPITIRERPVFVSASIGLTVASGRDRDADDLVRDADIAMYRAKAAGKAQVVVFEPSMSVNGLLDMESDLRHALDEQLLQVHYQPIVELSTGRVLGAEALVRWNHPTLGSVPPTIFVALAEETGLVRRLDQWVLETALGDLRVLHEHRPALELHVNLSAVHLHERDLPRRIAYTLNTSGVRAQMLTLEITETAAMWDPRRTVDSLAALHALGIGLALDDFGTGYSNFGYLKRFPLRAIKIDRSFVEHVVVDKQDAAIVAALITLSESLGLDVIAEGVETREQQQSLLALGCHRAQGFLFSPAVPLGEFTAQLELG